MNRKEEDNKIEQASKNNNNFIIPKSRQRANRRRENKIGTDRNNIGNTFEILDLETDSDDGHRTADIEREHKEREEQTREGMKENKNFNEVQMQEQPEELE